MSFDLDRLLRDRDAELIAQTAARSDNELIFAIARNRCEVAVDDGFITHRDSSRRDDNALGVFEPNALVLSIRVDREVLTRNEKVDLFTTDDKTIGLVNGIENREDRRLRALSNIDGLEVCECCLKFALGIDEGRELIFLAIPRGIRTIERTADSDARGDRLELEAVALGELANDFGLSEFPDVSDALLVFARTFSEEFYEVLRRDCAVVLYVSGVARGVVSLFERAQASSIAKFSHSFSFRWLLVVAVSE